MAKYRKRPIEIEALRFDGTHASMLECFAFCGNDPATMITPQPEDTTLMIHTLEGVMHATPGDWIIKGVAGEFYPCKPDIFEKTYEPADR